MNLCEECSFDQIFREQTRTSDGGSLAPKIAHQQVVSEPIKAKEQNQNTFVTSGVHDELSHDEVMRRSIPLGVARCGWL